METIDLLNINPYENENLFKFVTLSLFEEKITENIYNITNSEYKHIFLQFYQDPISDKDYILYFIAHGFNKEDSISYLREYEKKYGYTFENINDLYYFLINERRVGVRGWFTNIVSKFIHPDINGLYSSEDIFENELGKKLITYFKIIYAKSNHFIHTDIDTIENVFKSHPDLPQFELYSVNRIYLYNPIDGNKYLNTFDRVPRDEIIMSDNWIHSFMLKEKFLPTYILLSLDKFTEKIISVNVNFLINSGYRWTDGLFFYRKKDFRKFEGEYLLENINLRKNLRSEIEEKSYKEGYNDGTYDTLQEILS